MNDDEDMYQPQDNSEATGTEEEENTLEDDTIDAREAAFLEGYSQEEDLESKDYGLDEDEIIED